MIVCEECQAPEICMQNYFCVLKWVKSKSIPDAELKDSPELATPPDFTDEDHSTIVVKN